MSQNKSTIDIFSQIIFCHGAFPAKCLVAALARCKLWQSKPLRTTALQG